MKTTESTNLEKNKTGLSGKIVCAVPVCQASLYESRILSLAILHAENSFDKMSGGYRPTAVIYNRELVEDYDTQSGSFYRKLHTALNRLNMLHIFTAIKNDSGEVFFRYSNLISMVEYNRGKITVYFEPRIATSEVLDAMKKYKELSQNYISKFRSVYSWKIYEALVSGCFYWNRNVPVRDGWLVIDFQPGMFRILCGLIDLANSHVSSLLCKDYETFENDIESAYINYGSRHAYVTLYPEYGELYRNVIEPSLREINSVSDINVWYQPVRAGKGGKTSIFRFYVKCNSDR